MGNLDTTLSKDDTKVLKSIAVLLMLMHHLWFFPERIATEGGRCPTSGFLASLPRFISVALVRSASAFSFSLGVMASIPHSGASPMMWLTG